MTHLTTPIAALVACEADRARDLHGRTYASHHEGYGVLAEEVQEAEEELSELRDSMQHLLRYIRVSCDPGIRLTLSAIKDSAIRAAAELTQVAAVCQKWEGSIKEVTK